MASQHREPLNFRDLIHQCDYFVSASLVNTSRSSASMAVDPASALSAASAAVQFVQFASHIVSKGRHIYNSANGATRENEVTETVTLRLKELTGDLAKRPISNATRLSSGPLGNVQRYQKQVQDICNECSKISKALLDHLYKLKVPKGSEHRKWKSFRHALKTVWSKKELDEMAERLRGLRAELDSHMLAILR